MNRRHTLAWFACTMIAQVLIVPASAQHRDRAGSMSDEDFIKSAMTAAPPAVARDAGIVAVSADGQTRIVRRGTNGFTCRPDNPSTPGPDPMCGDRNAVEWAQAWLEKREPPRNKGGVLYMLSGGTDASNTDPNDQKPEADNNWVETGSHVMIVGTKGMMTGHPRDALQTHRSPT